MSGRPPLVRSALHLLASTLLFTAALLVTMSVQPEEAQATHVQTCSYGGRTYNYGDRWCNGNNMLYCYTYGRVYTYTYCQYGCHKPSGDRYAYCRCASSTTYPTVPGTNRCVSNRIYTCNLSTGRYGSRTSSTCYYGCTNVGSSASCRCPTGYPSPGAQSCTSGTRGYIRRCNVSTSYYGSSSSNYCYYGCYSYGSSYYCKCANNRSYNQYYCSGNYIYRCNLTTSTYGSATYTNYCQYSCTNWGSNEAYCRCGPYNTNPNQYFCSSTNRYRCNASKSRYGSTTYTACPSGYVCNTANPSSGQCIQRDCRDTVTGRTYSHGSYFCGTGNRFSSGQTATARYRYRCYNGQLDSASYCYYGCYQSGSTVSCRCPSGYPNPGAQTCTSGTRGYIRVCNVSSSRYGSYTSNYCYYGCYSYSGQYYCKCASNRTVNQTYCTSSRYIYRCNLSRSTYGSTTYIAYCNYYCTNSGNSAYCRCYPYNSYANQYFCIGSTRYQCRIPSNVASYRNGYYVRTDCPAGQVCNPNNPSSGQCITNNCTNGSRTYRNGEYFCGDGTRYNGVATSVNYRYVCTNGLVQQASTSSTYYYCQYGCYKSGTQAYCRCPGGRMPGQSYCNGTSVYRCSTTPSTYRYGSYGYYYCSYGCYYSGSNAYCRCSGGRIGGQRYCSGTSLYQCNYTLSRYGSTSRVGCNTGQVCRNNQCVSATCTYGGRTYQDGQYFCVNSYRYRCDGANNRVLYQSTCYYGCYASGTQAYCKCSNGTVGGQYFCQGRNRYRCNTTTSAYGSSSYVACPSGQFCSGNGSCSACVCSPGSRRCSSTNAKLIEVCDTSCTKWNTYATCSTGQFCSGAQCQACVCSPGAIRCSGNKVEICLSSCSGWTVSLTCAANEYCVNGSCRGCTCTAGSRRCNGNAVEVCDVNCQRWYTSKSCTASSGTYCNNGNCSACTCNPGAKRCTGKNIEVCQADCNTWSVSSSCSATQYCSGGTCQACQCTPGAKRCNGANVESCKADCSGWAVSTACQNGQFCFNNACSNCKCAPGSTRCNGQNIEKCDASCQNWTSTGTCSAGQKCISYNSTAQCRPTNWCPYTTATKTPICNNKICENNICTTFECKTSVHCAQGQVCNPQTFVCESSTCSYNNTVGVFSTACYAKTPTKAYCALYKCRECRYDYTSGQVTSECQKNYPDRPYCAKYGCRECASETFTQDSQCLNINSDYKYCVNYKCAQCPHQWKASDTQYCGGNPCKDYYCAKCNNSSTTPQYSSQCATLNAAKPYCKQYQCVECPETNSTSAICQGKYTSRPFCNANNVCVECPGVGFSGYCKSRYSKNYCFEGQCRECSSASMTKKDKDCLSLYTDKPNCYQYKCVECSNASDVGVYDTDICTSTYGNAPANKRYCAGNKCVQCPHKNAQKTTACPPDKSICSNYTCHECVANSDCPIGQTCQANKCKTPTQQCGDCKTDAWCQQNTTSGANCGAGKNRCNPKTNTCVICLIDSDCNTGESCDLKTNTCVRSNCPAYCTTSADCQQSGCNGKTACVNNKCIDPGPGSTCVQANIMLQVDRSCSMTWGNVDTRQPCTSSTQCRTYFQGLVPSYNTRYSVSCSYSSSVGQNTCHAQRWDVAMAALRKVIHDFGGTAANGYRDRKVRWGLAFFSSTSYIPGGTNPPANPANWGGISDTPNTAYLISTMQGTAASGGTAYVPAFRMVEQHLIATYQRDATPSRKSAVIFCTDGAPGDGGGYQCPTPATIVDRIYNMPDAGGQPRKIHSYIVGFGNGLGANGEACLKNLATKGRSVPTVCNTGTCLGYYAADSAADLANALQDIVNQATQEVCDGLDNDCDGLVDNNTVDACSCVMSYSRPTPTTSVNPQTSEFRAGVRLYTFLGSFDISGTCPQTNSVDDNNRKTYMEACRNNAIKATSCTPSKSNQIHPAGDAYDFYTRRCCGNGSTTNTCSWPTQHACQVKPWGASNCEAGMKSFCQTHKTMALNCAMPKGILLRSGTGYDSSGNLTVLTVKDFGEEGVNLQRSRSIFVHIPGRDYRSYANADNRPLIANVNPDEYVAPTAVGTSFGSIDPAHRFHPNNLSLTAGMLGISSAHCSSATDCARDREELIWFILGYDGSGKETRKSRLGAVYHSTPAVAGPVRANVPDPGFEAWVQETQPAGSFSNKTVRDRPSVVFVGTADGIMHAFNVNTGVELWGYVPRYFLEPGPRDSLREAINGAREDGTRAHLVDGSPVVQDIQMYRRVDSSGNVQAKWRTVLLFGLRAGGRAYVAIDVTNPYKPRLLWEISKASYKLPGNTAFGKFDKMGLTYGQPHIANVLINFEGVVQERAVAFLPGGLELKRSQTNSTWILDYNSTQGSVVYAVDLESGKYLTELSTRHTAQSCSGGSVTIERGVAAAPVGYNVAPALTTRVFFGDMHGNLFRVNLESQNPATWQADKFFALFGPCETPRPMMAAPSIALNEKGEVILYGGTGDLENIDDKDGFNKIFSIREVLPSATNTFTTVTALPNYVFKLDKLTGDGPDEPTIALGSGKAQITSGAQTGERLTGAPVIFGGTAYFTTYITDAKVPVCGVRGYSRLYGIHYNDGCRTENCGPLATGGPGNPGVFHYYHRVSGYVQGGQHNSPNAGISTSGRTPLQPCEGDNSFGGANNSPPSDVAVKNGVQLGKIVCGDLNFTVPMLQDTSSTAPYEYYRYHALGQNTLAMGATFAYQPGEVDITRSSNPNTGDSYHRFNTKRPGTQYLTFQVAGKSPAANNQWRLNKLRAVKIPAKSQQKGAFSTIGAANTFAPVSLFSWGRVLD